MRVSCLTGNTTSLWGMGRCTRRVVRVESALLVHSAIAAGWFVIYLLNVFL